MLGICTYFNPYLATSTSPLLDLIVWYRIEGRKSEVGEVGKYSGNFRKGYLL